MLLTLGQAAKLAGVGKTTLARAIAKGTLSASRKADGSYAVDPAELTRVYPVPSGDSGATVEAVHRATVASDPETATRLAALEQEVKGLKDLLAEVRQSRDDWKGQAERLALPSPEPGRNPLSSPSPNPVGILTGWSRWWRRAG
jgi:hypothetical protein